MASRILIVEDDIELSENLKSLLEGSGFDVESDCDGAAALKRVHEGAPFDLILLDLMLPELDGVAFLQAVRARADDIPVLIISGRAALESKLALFELGADDYLVKPFAGEELVMRAKALLRRTRRAEAFSNISARLGNATFYPFDFSLRGRDGSAAELSNMESRLLVFLIENRGQVLSRETLLAKVWGVSGKCQTRTVDMFITRLRKVLDATAGDGVVIESVRGSGYVLKVNDR